MCHHPILIYYNKMAQTLGNKKKQNRILYENQEKIGIKCN